MKFMHIVIEWKYQLPKWNKSQVLLITNLKSHQVKKKKDKKKILYEVLEESNYCCYTNFIQLYVHTIWSYHGTILAFRVLLTLAFSRLKDQIIFDPLILIIVIKVQSKHPFL